MGLIPFILLCWTNWIKVVEVLFSLDSIKLVTSKLHCPLQIPSLEKLTKYFENFQCSA